MSVDTDRPSDPRAYGLIELGVRPPLDQYVRQIADRWEFLTTVAIGDLRARNQNTVLGSIWHLLNPMFLAAVYFTVFGILFDARGDVPNYITFLVAGLFTFYFTQKSTLSGSRTVVSNLELIRSINLPRALMPLSGVVTEGLAHGPAMLTVLLLAVATGEFPVPRWLLLVPALGLQAMFNAGVALVAARMTFHYRDVQQALPYTLRLWLYLSGVFYTADRVPEGLARTLFELNPAYLYISLVRDAVLGGYATQRTWLLALAWAVVMALGGFVYFWLHESEYGRE